MIAYVTEVIVEEGEMDETRNRIRNSPKSENICNRSMESQTNHLKSQKTRPLQSKENVENRSTPITKREIFEEKMKIAKQKREEELERKRLGVIAAQQRAEEFRKKQLEERKKKILEQRLKESEKQQAVLNRRKKMEEESKVSIGFIYVYKYILYIVYTVYTILLYKVYTKSCKPHYIYSKYKYK